MTDENRPFDIPGREPGREVAYRDRYVPDPYAAFASEGSGGIVGDLLTNKKGTWGIGSEGVPPPEGARYLALMPSLTRGWVKWMGGKPVDARMGLVHTGFTVPHRDTLGDLDVSQWEMFQDQPRDPWSEVLRLVLVALAPPHRELTFTGSSYGTKLALTALCKEYSDSMVNGSDKFPVVELATHTRDTKSYGKIVGPSFRVVGWASVSEVRSSLKAGAGVRKLEEAI